MFGPKIENSTSKISHTYRVLSLTNNINFARSKYFVIIAIIDEVQYYWLYQNQIMCLTDSTPLK